MQCKIIFFGTPEFGALILEGLIKNNYKPVLVITVPDKPMGRKKNITPPPVKILAEKYNISVFQPEKIRNEKNKIQNIKPDLIILAAYGQILPNDILEIPKYGSLNVHPSLLPRWRGPSPVQATILANDQKTGVTIMKMTEKVDKGPILGQKEIELTQKETYPDLHNTLGKLGADLLVEIIPKWIGEEILPKPQDDTNATYSKIIKKEDGRIDWGKTTEEIERQIRGLNPWPGTFTTFRNKNIKILKARLSEKLGEKLLIIETVQPEGKKSMSFADFLRGYPDFRENKEICSHILI